MAAKRLPTQFPTIVARRFNDFKLANSTITTVVIALEDLRKRLILVMNDHADLLDGLQLPLHTDANRGAAGTTGRLIFNTDDGKMNVDDGTNWTLPDGTTT